MDIKPIILSEGAYNEKDIINFRDAHKIWCEKNILSSQLAELFEIDNPQLRTYQDFSNLQQQYIANYLSSNSEIKGDWIYFPWNGYLIHSIKKSDYFRLLTNRNKNIITAEEQEILFNQCVAFAGLSVGSHFAAGLAHNGISGKMKLADFDKVSNTNLNRMKGGINDIGEMKVNVIAEEIFEVNPYLQLYLQDRGLKDKYLDEFIFTEPKPSLIFEMIDDFKMKIRLRLAARRAAIPLIMLTHLGDNLLVDIERYDLNVNLQPFNGLLGNLPEEILNSEITENDKVKFAVEIVSRKYLPDRLYKSLMEINIKLAGRPQLYSSVSIGGGIASYLTRKILLDKLNLSGRYFISFDKLFDKK